MCKKRILLALAGVLVLSAFNGALAETNTVKIMDARIDPTPPSARTATATLTLVSSGADRLTGANSPVADRVGLHSMAMDHGVMKMRPLGNGLDLPAGQPVSLKNKNVHLMLTGIKHQFVSGETIPVTLTFAKAVAQTVPFKVAPAQGADDSGMVGMSGMMH